MALVPEGNQYRQSLEQQITELRHEVQNCKADLHELRTQINEEFEAQRKTEARNAQDISNSDLEGARLMQEISTLRRKNTALGRRLHSTEVPDTVYIRSDHLNIHRRAVRKSPIRAAPA